MSAYQTIPRVSSQVGIERWRWTLVCMILACVLSARGLGQSSPVPIQNADVNQDGLVSMADVAIVQANLGRKCGQSNLDPQADVNRDCVVNVTDVSFVSRNLGAKFPPTIRHKLSAEPNAAGWHKADVTVSFECTGTPTCPGPVTVTTEGEKQVVQRTVSNAGGSTTARVELSLDKTAPVIQFTSPADNSSTPTTPIEVHGTLSSGGSPIVSVACNSVSGTVSPPLFTCTVPLPAEGPNDINATASDAAGNAGSATLHVSYEAPKAPTISSHVSPEPNPAEWNKTDVTISFTCTNATACQEPITVSTEGANQVFHGTATGPGGTATTEVTVNIDKTVPVEVFTAAPPAAVAPGGTADLSVTVSDNTAVVSVVFMVDGAVVSTRATDPFDFSFVVPSDSVIGTTRVFTVEARDAAGNSTVLTQSVSITRVSHLTLDVDPPKSPTFQGSASLTGSVDGSTGGTSITVVGGASAASKSLASDQMLFGLDVPLRPNAENVLRVTATDSSGQTTSASDIRVIQLSLSSLVTAQVTAQRLTAAQVEALVANGTINLSDPANFNVSTFALSLNVAGRPAPVTVPIHVIKPIHQAVGMGPAITLECGAPDSDITETATGYSIPCDNKDTLPPLPKIQIVPFEIEFPEDSPIAGAPAISGVILLNGQIKTLKEFFKATLLLTNVSTTFTLSALSAKISIPDNGLSPVAPASGALTMDDLGSGAQGSGEFIIRGDLIGTHTVTVDFGGQVTGGGLNTPVAFSGSASTSVEVKGPPNLNVTVAHPVEVTAGEPYTLTVNIQDTSTIDALYASLELDLGGVADLIDPSTGLPFTGANVASLGHILAGQTVSQSYTVVPRTSGRITSCIGGATINIKLAVAFSGEGAPTCAIGTLPSQVVSPSGQPTVTVLPAPNTTNVPLNATISAFFSDAIQTQTLSLGPTGTFRLADETGALVGGELQFSPLTNGATAAVYHPSAPLEGSTTYTIFISPDIFDAKGARLASGVTASFTTAPPPPADTTAPHVTMRIKSPADPSAIPEGQLISVLVDSTDDSGTVSRLDLQLDGQLVDARGPVSSVTFLVDSSELEPGSSHVLTAMATDPAGNTASVTMSLSIVGDSTSPTASLTVANRLLRGEIPSVSIQANDDVRIARVQVFLDGGADPIYSGSVAPYQFSLNTTSLANGPHQLFALVTDGAGNTAQAAQTVGVVSITGLAISPAALTITGIGASQALVVTGTFSDGSVAPVTSGLTFLSSNPGRATVNSSGVVTAVAPGTATVATAVQAPAPLLATVVVTIIAGDPTALTFVSGDQQTAVIGQAAAAPLVVSVTDASGRPVPGVGVSFQSVSGGGTLTPVYANTDGQGRASTTLTLGATPGPIVVTATAGSLAGSPVTFHVRGISNQPPTLTNPGNQSSTQATAVSLQLTGSDPNGDPLTFSVSGLPASLGVNGATGLIAGTLSVTAGAYSVTVTASNGTLSASQTFTWTVTAPLTPFVDLATTISPAQAVSSIGGSITYTVTTSNLGTAPATNVETTDALPAALVFVDASAGCVRSGSAVSCSDGTLAPGQIVAHTIVAVPYAPGQITNSVAVSSAQADVASINNTASAVIMVVNAPPGAPGVVLTGAAELFTPASSGWTATGAMTIPRGGSTLTVLGDGTVLVLGGIEGSSNPPSAVATGELYNPTTGTWTATASLAAPRAFHTATLLSTGDVLISGGVDAAGNPMSTTQLYRGPPIQKVVPVVTWSTPAPIAHGTPIATTQLNASSSIAGAFVYSPPLGTVLPIGEHSLSVTFTPADSIHYSTVAATIRLTVLP